MRTKRIDRAERAGEHHPPPATHPLASLIDRPRAFVVCIGTEAVFQFSMTRLIQGLVVSIGFGLCVPSCGYIGARNRSKPLICCFSCCNGCNACTLTFTVVAILGVVSILHSPYRESCTHSTKWYVNTGWSDFRECCSQFSDCNWDPDQCSVGGCPMPSVNLTAYVFGSHEHCDFQRNQTSPPASPSPSRPNAGAAHDDCTVLCTAEAMCMQVEQLPADFQLKDWFFYAYAAFMVLACVPSTLGCCWGYSLYTDPHVSRPPAAVAGYVRFPCFLLPCFLHTAAESGLVCVPVSMYCRHTHPHRQRQRQPQPARTLGRSSRPNLRTVFTPVGASEFRTTESKNEVDVSAEVFC